MLAFFHRLVVLCLCCFYPLLAYSWSAPAHRIIAQIAYDNLQPEAKQQVAYLTALFEKNYQQKGRFETSSLWADQIAMRDIQAFGSWHYINKPFSPDNTPLPIIDKQNVIWAIEQSYKVLKSDKPKPFEKALFLRFLVHFVADIHQPLHCISRVTKEHPQGDRGGNLYLINVPGIENLHAYWDSALGQYQQYYQQNAKGKCELVASWAKILQVHHPISLYQRQLKKSAPEKWADESYELAVSFAYSVAEKSAPSNKYLQKGRAISEQRIALAGYRLAALLNKAFAKK